LVLVFDVVDTNAYDSIAAIPASEDFALDPFTCCGFGLGVSVEWRLGPLCGAYVLLMATIGPVAARLLK